MHRSAPILARLHIRQIRAVEVPAVLLLQLLQRLLDVSPAPHILIRHLTMFLIYSLYHVYFVEQAPFGLRDVFAVFLFFIFLLFVDKFFEVSLQFLLGF